MEESILTLIFSAAATVFKLRTTIGLARRGARDTFSKLRSPRRMCDCIAETSSQKSGQAQFLRFYLRIGFILHEDSYITFKG
jgi:hypothetical protein